MIGVETGTMYLCVYTNVRAACVGVGFKCYSIANYACMIDQMRDGIRFVKLFAFNIRLIKLN